MKLRVMIITDQRPQKDQNCVSANVYHGGQCVERDWFVVHVAKASDSQKT